MPKTNTPTISIAMCTFNGSAFLREQLDSLLAQTYPWQELIVVDDQSSDNTMDILREYQKRDGRIKVQQNQNNIGTDKNFLKALKLCTCDFVAPCDQDDIWFPEKLSSLIDVIGKHSLAYSDSELIHAEGTKIRARMSDYVSMISGSNPSEFVFRNCVSGHASLVSAEVVNHITCVPEGFHYDWWLAANATSLNGIIYLDIPLVFHRQHANNATNILRDGKLVTNTMRNRGYKLKRLHTTIFRIESLAKLSSKDQLFLTVLHELWLKCESEWFCPKLAWTMLIHGLKLYAPQKSVSLFFLAKLAYSSFWGIKSKRLVNRYAYQA